MEVEQIKPDSEDVTSTNGVENELLQEVQQQNETAQSIEETGEEIIKYDEDELLVKLVHSYRFLWDPLTKGYKDNEEKKRAWKDISSALNKDSKFTILLKQYLVRVSYHTYHVPCII